MSGQIKLKSLHLAACALFLALICAPILTIAAFGPDPANQGRPLMLDLLAPRMMPRAALDTGKGLAAEILERSPLRSELIGLRSGMAYDLLGYIDTTQIVSGRDGWLFWKEEFWKGKCIADTVWTSLFNEMDTMSALAKPTGMKLVFAIAPDKSTLYPEQLHPRSAQYWNCKAENGARWRALAAERAPDLIDHKKALEPAKASGVPLFFATDTHWNLYGAAVATRQLVSATLGIPAAELAEAVPVPATYQHRTDMRGMLKLAGSDLSPLPNDEDEARFVARAARDGRTTAILHDSFYLYNRDLLDAVFEGTNRFYIATLEGMDNVVLRNPSLLIVEAVERTLLVRFGPGPYGMSGPLGQSILTNNKKASRRCIFNKANEVDTLAAPQLHQLTRRGRKFHAEGDPQITLALPEDEAGSPCVSISLTVEVPTILEIFLPPRRGRTSSAIFEAGRVIPVKLTAGENHVKLILPDDLSVRKIRIDPVMGAQDFVIDTIAWGKDGGVDQPPIYTSALR